MKIMHIITTLDRGGAEQQLLILVGEQIKNGDKVIVCALKGNNQLVPEFRELGATVIEGVANKRFIFQVFLVWKLLRTGNFILHAHLPAAELLSSIVRGKHKLIISKHNAEPMYRKSLIISRLLASYVEFRSDLCIAISNAVKTFLLDSGEWHGKGNLRVIHYGINLKRENRLDKNLNANTVKFLTVARLVPQKNISLLLRAFQEVHLHFPQDSLTVVGNGFLKSDLIKLADSLNISEVVHFVGKTDNIEQFYEVHDVFVLSSLYEGFGLVLLEAGLYSMPIIASNISAIPEVLGDNFPGLAQSDNVDHFASLMKKCHSLEYQLELQKNIKFRISLFDAHAMYSKVKLSYLQS